MSYILKVKNVCKSFGDLKAVDNLSFEVEEGQIFGIAGPNGAGKTTLFNSITGIPLKPDSGEIYFKGIPVHPLPAHKIYYLGIARTFQMETVFESLTVFENVMIANIYGKKSKVKRNNEELVYRVLGMVGLNDKDILHKQARHLPLFDKKKLMLASALVTNPKILFLDEPVSGLNNPESEEVSKLIRKLNRSNMTIVLIEHVLPILINLSDKLMIMNEGKKLIEGLPKNIMSNKKVIKVYLGER